MTNVLPLTVTIAALVAGALTWAVADTVGPSRSARVEQVRPPAPERSRSAAPVGSVARGRDAERPAEARRGPPPLPREWVWERPDTRLDHMYRARD